MNNIVVNFSDENAKEINRDKEEALISGDLRRVPGNVFDRKIENLSIVLDQLFSGWTDCDFDKVEKSSDRIMLRGALKYGFGKEIPKEFYAGFHLYFLLLYIKEIPVDNLKILSDSFIDFVEIGEEIKMRDDLQKKILELEKEKSDIEAANKYEINKREKEIYRLKKRLNEC